MHNCEVRQYRALSQLPGDYGKTCEMNLQSDRKLRLKIAGSAVLLILVLGLAGNALQPIPWEVLGDFRQIPCIFLSIIGYMILHELVHGLFMHIFSGKQAHYGFRQSFAAARSEMFFPRKSYLTIALAPVVIWGTLLGILCDRAWGTDWFWAFYLIETVNLSGAVSDLYVVGKLSLYPRDLLVRDTGTAIQIFVRK